MKRNRIRIFDKNIGLKLELMPTLVIHCSFLGQIGHFSGKFWVENTDNFILDRFRLE